MKPSPDATLPATHAVSDAPSVPRATAPSTEDTPVKVPAGSPYDYTEGEDEPRDELAAAVATRKALREALAACGSELAERGARYRHDIGERLEVALTGVAPASPGRAVLEIEKFIGGGFAGQVYRVRLCEVHFDGEPVRELAVGKRYAIKIMKPPSGMGRAFRDTLYKLGYQAPFPYQFDLDAVRAGSLWQKLIRRAAKLRFGSDRHVVDTYATFFDEKIGAYGEINEWVEGRNWKLETDARIFERKHFLNEAKAGDDEPSPEYLAKFRFMRDFVTLLHELGAHEFARQYEWSTWKSQPNVLKRVDGAGELTAIDFRAGLTLLCVLPMSPGDFRLVLKGLARGRLAQFDGGKVERLKAFVLAHRGAFEDLLPALEELKARDERYRESQPDLINRPWRLATKLAGYADLRARFARAWKTAGLIDGDERRIERSRVRFTVYNILWWIPLLGSLAMRGLGHAGFRAHAFKLLTSPRYLLARLRASRIRALIRWHHAGRVDDAGARARVDAPLRFALERFTVSWLPAKAHRFMTDNAFAWKTIKSVVGFPYYFYMRAEFREDWLRARLRAAQRDGMLTEDEEQRIEGHIADPFIQKYLQCMAVHFLMSPVTTFVRFALAFYFALSLGETFAHSLKIAIAVLALFQMLPVTPGSIVRGLYVVYVMIRERNYRDYRVAAMVSFWHYIGYLGFPIQMVTRYPTLARFLAARWAKKVVRLVPVFGEAGALLEHKVFDLFFNLPISLRARFSPDEGEEAPSLQSSSQRA